MTGGCIEPLLRQNARSRPWCVRNALISCIVAVAACGQDAARDDVSYVQDPFDPYELRIPALHDLVMGPESNLVGMRLEEMPFEGPFIDDQGRRLISVRTTGYHAQLLAERWGFTAEGHRRAVRTDVDPVESSASAPPVCNPDTKYLKDYDDIVAELQVMDASSPFITTFSIGPTATVDPNTPGTGREIMAVQFGPIQPADDVPTVFLLGTHHAREWITTGVTLGLARWLHEVITTGNDPDTLAMLQNAAVVIVPVANPDGYQWTRTTDRSWRGNRDVATCARGVNLNRNMTTTFGEPAYGVGICGGDNYPGASLSAENESLEALLNSDSNLHRIAALVSYHSYADMLIYPTGYKAVSDIDGPRCGLSDNFQCFNPDFTLYRDVFGDTHSNLWIDRQSLPPDEFPFFRDHTHSLLYGVSGDTGHGVNYSPIFGALSVTPELQGNIWGFYVECEDDSDGLIASVVEDQRDVVRRLIAAAPGLVTDVESEAWGPRNVGTLSSGLWVREYRSASQHLTARPMFIKSVWKPADTGNLSSLINGTMQNYNRGRPGAEYNLYYVEHGLGYDWEKLPCEIVSSNESGSSVDSAPDCDDYVDLCDGSRLPASGFALIDGARGGQRDCWWEATSDAELNIPAGSPRYPDKTTHCHVTFSLEWSQLSGSVSVERTTDGRPERIFAINAGNPYYPYPPAAQRLYSYAFEANQNLPDRTQAFRIVLEGDAKYVRVYDPVTYCRSRGE